MDLSQALSVKTAVEKQRLLTALSHIPGITDIVNDAFSEADRIWVSRLENMVGAQAAQQVSEALKKQVSVQQPDPSLFVA